jgi:hypothetical protein
MCAIGEKSLAEERAASPMDMSFLFQGHDDSEAWCEAKLDNVLRFLSN